MENVDWKSKIGNPLPGDISTAVCNYINRKLLKYGPEISESTEEEEGVEVAQNNKTFPSLPFGYLVFVVCLLVVTPFLVPV